MMKTKTSRHLVAAAACASMMAAGITAYSPSAEACGGLFCNNQQPVNQAAERIIFSDNADDTVTALVQIMYQGPSERFAWVLPVPGEPDVSVSSTAAFDRLQTATNPSYRMNTTVEGTCDTDRGFGFENDGAATAGGSANNLAGDPREEGGVTVVNSGNVGPYDYTTISVDPGTQNPTQVALDWLSDNRYDVSALGEQTITPYLEDGMNLLAFRLSKNADAGDIRPVRITYDAELPMIPIKLTAVAANDDMGVMVWVLSDERAIPSNYKSLRLNEAAIDWFNPNNNYNDVINRAADEAGGQGFVTELAWPTNRTLPPNQFNNGAELTQVVFSENDQRYWEDSIRDQDWTGNEWGLIQQSTRYAGFDGYVEVVDSTVPIPSRITAEDFAQCPTCYRNEIGGNNADIDNFDPQTFITQLDLNVVKPMIETQALINSRPYLTRLYTTMSAADMTLDPVFDFNASLGDHSNAHVAERIIECGDEDYTRAEAPWRVELPQGDTVFGSGNSWPVSSDEMPATRAIVQDRNSGDGEVVVDNAPEIDSFIQRHNERVSDEFSGGGCQTAHSASASLARNMSLALMFGAFGLLLIRVRSRREE